MNTNRGKIRSAFAVSAVLSVLAVLTLLISTTLSSSLSFADTPAGDSDTHLHGGTAAVTGKLQDHGFSARLYNSENGLPTSDANTVFTSDDGFIWIGGYSGLIRYDGTSFVRQDSTDGITSVNVIFEDSKGRMWIGTNDNGIVMTEGSSSVHYTYKEGLRSSSIRCITEDAEGNILIGSTYGIYYIDSEMKLHDLKEPQIYTTYINQIFSDENGTIYGAAKNGSVFCIEDLHLKEFYSGNALESGDISAVYPVPDSPGKIYLASNAGYIYEGDFTNGLKNLRTILDPHGDGPHIRGNINRITYVGGYLWVLTENEIGYFDESEQICVPDNLPMTSGITSLVEDYEGNLWVASTRQGVMKIVSNQYTDITEEAGLDHLVVNASCFRNGVMYIGTDLGLQIIGSDNRKTENELTEYIGNARIRCIMTDKKNDLWISTYSNDLGLICCTSAGKIISFTENDNLASNRVRCTAFTPDGSVLAGTDDGLSVIKDGKVIRNISSDSGISTPVILTALCGSDGCWYLGTDGGGIFVIDGNRISKLGRENGLTSDVIMRIREDKERGLYWIVTSNSIQYLKDGVIKSVENFPYSNNYDLFFDSNGKMWTLSSNGIYVADAEDVLSGNKFEYLFYDTSNGLPSVPTGNSYSSTDSRGNLFISCRTGVTRVNMDHYFEQSGTVKFSVPYIEADGIKYYPDQSGTIKLPSAANTVTVYCHVLTYTLQNPKIQYFLDGMDNEPTTVRKSEMEPVRYTNLKGKPYVFDLSLLDNTNQIQQKFSINVVKEKKIHEHIWFPWVCVILGLVALEEISRLYVKRRTSYYRKRDRESKTFVREMIEAFAKTIDMKDKYTNGHSKRVANYTAMLTRELGCDEDTVEKYYNIALLHDIGKIGIPAEVLNKPGKLTDKEYSVIQSHSTLGYSVLKDISIMPELATGAHSHHERPDGKGYPQHLKGGEIPRVAQIIAVADCFDAMYSNRPYRDRMNFDKAVSIIKEVSGTQLTTDVVEAFLRLVEKGEFRDPNDKGGGSTENIDNIHEKYGMSK
ncbi:HD domain-containing phosphohydrolase [Ruminococcus sp. HUN007]|uniref:HD domain-containing phosphohydrolase n=1 Tax=Ruminococcus sp. HUN007 TaxID=1514668 RepID=UPI0006793C60|nr:HD domain-containing phosphohydrolase [Ruminococcus sp. HUN007]